MTAVRIKALVALVLMVCAFSGALAWRPTLHLADQRPRIDLESMFPRAFGEWVIDDRMPVQLVSPDTQALLSKIYNQTLSRTYINRTGDRIMLSVAYGGDQSDATRAHRPEVCYPAQGFQLLSNEKGTLTTPLRALPVRHLVAKMGGRVEPITYWIVVGDRVALSGTEQKLAQLSYSVRGVVPDGMLIRLSNISNDSAAAYGVHQRFMADMARAIHPDLLAQVLGSAGT